MARRCRPGNGAACAYAAPLPVSYGAGTCSGATRRLEDVMLQYALVFFIIAIIAAVFGFGGIAAGAAAIAKILFYIFLVIFLVSLVLGIARRG
jgi:uncharacterized membrane protein YtjA (UPF0391 family)